MHLPTLCLLLSTTSALPTSWPPTFSSSFPTGHHGPHPATCITPSFANLTFTRIRSILALQPTDLGSIASTFEQILAPNYLSTSDSYSMLGGRLDQVGEVGTVTKEDEIAEAGRLAGLLSQTGIETLALGPVGCRAAVWFWNLTRLGGEEVRYPIRAWHYLTFNQDFQIETLHTETNALAYAADLGFTIEYPNGTVLPSMKTGGSSNVPRREIATGYLGRITEVRNEGEKDRGFSP